MVWDSINVNMHVFVNEFCLLYSVKTIVNNNLSISCRKMLACELFQAMFVVLNMTMIQGSLHQNSTKREITIQIEFGHKLDILKLKIIKMFQ